MLNVKSVKQPQSEPDEKKHCRHGNSARNGCADQQPSFAKNLVFQKRKHEAGVCELHLRETTSAVCENDPATEQWEIITEIDLKLKQIH